MTRRQGSRSRSNSNRDLMRQKQIRADKRVDRQRGDDSDHEDFPQTAASFRAMHARR